MVSDAELLTYVPGATVIRRAIDMEKWSYVSLSRRERPTIVHTPSRKGIKGIARILAAVDILGSEGLQFDFHHVENVPQSETGKIYEDCDIVVDQILTGWYGVLSVEGMALGKAVLSYIRYIILSAFTGDPPVMVANPDTILTVLRDLITSPRMRFDVAERGHESCRANHDMRLGQSLR